MQAHEIRNTFLEFFREKGHKIVPSAPIVVKNDPTLLFTNAGMNQFKDYFLGNKQAVDTRVADTQKCLRVSGKHNDLEEVGIDTYHHTMFEMLGNWSFGDYFKKEAISWAWELLAERFKMDKNRLYVTIFEGDSKEGLAEDAESLGIWQQFVEESHILRGSKKDNFWEMGDTGPCGPCTEIHYDIRTDEERTLVDGSTLVNNDHPQVIEIWNNVFIEFNRKADSSLEKLPAQHVDTGMGFERLVRVLQGKHSNYDTDIFQPLIRMMEVDLGYKYGAAEKTDIAFRVIADHIRAVTFAIGDGQLPSNTGAGYVIRRILRRAVRYGYTFLGMTEPYIHKLVTILANQFKTVFPEVYKQEDFIKKVIAEEEASFMRTLASGLKRFENEIQKLNKGVFPVAIAFELYDTYGFPFDLTQLIAREKGFEVDEEEYKRELGMQKARSKNAAAKEESDWILTGEDKGITTFLGYDQSEAEVNIIRYRKVVQKGETVYHIILDQTPFYPEGGGQVGDTGFLENENEKIEIITTFKENDLIIHVSSKLPVGLGASFIARVDAAKRLQTANNHSATHLVHAALRKVLGTHVAQKGSLVNNKLLRFDFSHFAKMTDEEIARVEHIVNDKIREDIPLKEDRAIPKEEAEKNGAMMLFGEKYGDKVRMITFDKDYSVELCGGIHTKSTGRLGFFKIVSESAVAAGVRRIEAVTGIEAENLINEQFRTIKEIESSLKNPKDILVAIEQLKSELKDLQVQIHKQGQVLEKNTMNRMHEILGRMHDFIKKEGNIPKIVQIQEFDIMFKENLEIGRNITLEYRKKFSDNIILLGARFLNECYIWLSIPDQFIKTYNLHAGKLIKEIAKEIDGNGGGQDFFGSAKGNNSINLLKALSKGADLIESQMNLKTD